MQNTGHGLTAAALTAGGILIGLDLAGLTAANPGLSLLECVCGVLTGLGLAGLWRKTPLTRGEKVSAALLLLIHIWTLWPWIAFLAGWLGGTGCHRIRRSLALLILPGALLAGFWALFQVLCPAEPGIPLWYRAAPVLLLCLYYWTFRHCWGANKHNAAGLLLRVLFFYGLAGGAALLLKRIVWPPEPWYFYAAWGIGMAACVAGMVAFPAARPCRRLLNLIMLTCALPVAGCLLLNLQTDLRFWGQPPQQRRNYERVMRAAKPVIRAAQEYRRKHGVWPENPAGLVPCRRVSGCFTGPDGKYRIVFQQQEGIPAAWFWVAAPEGAGSWELHAPAHPLLRRGERRYRHIFPASDEETVSWR